LPFTRTEAAVVVVSGACNGGFGCGGDDGGDLVGGDDD
jgi:hypothetical protein